MLEVSSKLAFKKASETSVKVNVKVKVNFKSQEKVCNSRNTQKLENAPKSQSNSKSTFDALVKSVDFSVRASARQLAPAAPAS